ncbi:MAG: hypothetical protein U0670_11420 [Anaerolineae bacterium]
MKTRFLLLTVIVIVAAAACAPATPTVVIPTLADLPTATPVTPTLTQAPDGVPPPVTPEPQIVMAVSPTGPSEQQQTLDALALDLTRESAELSTGIAGATSEAGTAAANVGATLAESLRSATVDVTSTLPPSFTPAGSDAPFITFTPSDTLDVTYTPAPTRTATPTPTEMPNGLELLALLSAQFTVLPPEVRYNEATRTGLAVAVTAAVETAVALTQNPPISGQPNAGATVVNGVSLATLPPPIGNQPPQALNCAAPPPSAISAVLSSEPALAASLGCPVGTSLQIGAASQSFERGTMIYISGSPGDIYALTSDLRFRRVPDTWTSGVDPDSLGLTPPSPGLIEPIRGFGKVWRSYADLQALIGWGTTGESGTTATMLLFEHGRAVYVPSLNQTFILILDSGSTDFGAWRTVIGSF